jgi:hypothetical protein
MIGVKLVTQGLESPFYPDGPIWNEEPDYELPVSPVGGPLNSEHGTGWHFVVGDTVEEAVALAMTIGGVLPDGMPCRILQVEGHGDILQVGRKVRSSNMTILGELDPTIAFPYLADWSWNWSAPSPGTPVTEERMNRDLRSNMVTMQTNWFNALKRDQPVDPDAVAAAVSQVSVARGGGEATLFLGNSIDLWSARSNITGAVWVRPTTYGFASTAENSWDNIRATAAELAFRTGPVSGDGGSLSSGGLARMRMFSRAWFPTGLFNQKALYSAGSIARLSMMHWFAAQKSTGIYVLMQDAFVQEESNFGPDGLPVLFGQQDQTAEIFLRGMIDAYANGLEYITGLAGGGVGYTLREEES